MKIVICFSDSPELCTKIEADSAVTQDKNQVQAILNQPILPAFLNL